MNKDEEERRLVRTIRHEGFRDAFIEYVAALLADEDVTELETLVWQMYELFTEKEDESESRGFTVFNERIEDCTYAGDELTAAVTHLWLLRYAEREEIAASLREKIHVLTQLRSFSGKVISTR